MYTNSGTLKQLIMIFTSNIINKDCEKFMTVNLGKVTHTNYSDKQSVKAKFNPACQVTATCKDLNSITK